jgi:hypothetical protein
MSGGPATPWGSMSVAEWRAANKKPKKSKYGNRKIVVDGIKFDSKREAKRWAALQTLDRFGTISQLERQVPYVLAPAVRLHDETRLKPAIRYVADFRYFDISAGCFVVEDVKGLETDVSRLKRHLMKSVHGIDVKIVR